MKAKPIGERALIKPLPQEEKVGSIIIPDMVKEKSRIGEIFAIGTGKEIRELFRVKDRVIFGKFAGEEISIENEKYLIVSLADILVKFESENES